MSEKLTLDAQPRQDVGKGASRRLRKEGLTPAIIYGGDKAETMVTLEHRQVMKALEHESFFTQILELNIAGESQQVVLQDLQRHPFKPVILHADFQRITGNEKMKKHVPLHFTGEEKAPGVVQGGIVNHHMKDVEILCPIRDLPEYLEVDISKLDINDVLHLSDLTLPKGATLPALALGAEHDNPVVSIHLPRAALEEEASEAAEEASASDNGEAAADSEE